VNKLTSFISRGVNYPIPKFKFQGGKMKTKRRQTFSIGDTAKMTGVSQRQIRHWEDRGYIGTAERIICGERAYRHFTKEQVGQIKTIKSLLDEGYQLSHASRMAANVKWKGGA
jgi:predicted transcriptional regulator